MDKFYSVSRYLRHRLLGSSPHGVHSPFVFELFNKVILDETPYYFYEKIESLRSKLLLNENLIEVTDFGTGGKTGKTRMLKVSSIASTFLQTRRNAQLISRLVTFFKPEIILELGTSLGITSLYLATPNKQNKVMTIEGCPNTRELAIENFKRMNVQNIESFVGEFDLSLPLALKKIDTLDFVYFDGNHTYDATIKYVELCMNKKHANTVFVFDDIHWSRSMSKAWTAIKEHKEVTLSIDLYHLGIIFFKTGIPKQHFNLKY